MRAKQFLFLSAN